MPKIVDHRERRKAVAEAASELIATTGVGALTIRAVADSLRYSAAIVQHYFPNKRDLLLYTLRYEGGRGQERVMQALANDPGNTLGLLAALMPIDEARIRSWKTWIAYLGTASYDTNVALEQKRLFSAVRDMIVHSLTVSAGEAGLRPALDLQAIARQLVLSVHGIGMDFMISPEEWPPEQQLKTVARLIEALSGLPVESYLKVELARLKPARSGRNDRAAGGRKQRATAGG